MNCKDIDRTLSKLEEKLCEKGIAPPSAKIKLHLAKRIISQACAVTNYFCMQNIQEQNLSGWCDG